MRIGAAFPSKYLKSSDLPADRHVGVVIDHVTIENVAGNDNPDDEKPVLYFQGKQKGMVLNKTNATTISNAYGDETDAWSGQSILLYVTDVQYKQSMVPSIRVKIDRAGGRASGTGNGTTTRRTATPPVQPPAESVPFGSDQTADEIPDF